VGGCRHWSRGEFHLGYDCLTSERADNVQEMGVTYDNRDRGVSDELYSILNAIEAGDLQPAIR
jgi:hypothetical protein